MEISGAGLQTQETFSKNLFLCISLRGQVQRSSWDNKELYNKYIIMRLTTLIKRGNTVKGGVTATNHPWTFSLNTTAVKHLAKQQTSHLPKHWRILTPIFHPKSTQQRRSGRRTRSEAGPGQPGADRMRLNYQNFWGKMPNSGKNVGVENNEDEAPAALREKKTELERNHNSRPRTRSELHTPSKDWVLHIAILRIRQKFPNSCF